MSLPPRTLCCNGFLKVKKGNWEILQILKGPYLFHIKCIMHSCSFWHDKWKFACTITQLYHFWCLFFKLRQSLNNPKENPYGPQPNSRGSCPLINPACPSAKHWISLQHWCIIQHRRGWERKSVVWSHLTLGGAAKRGRWRRRRGRNESNGSADDCGGGRQRGVGDRYDGGRGRNEVRD